MAKSSREWEQPLQHLRYLFVVYERAKGEAGNDRDAQSEFDAVEDLDIKDRARSEAVGSQEIDEVGWSHVEVDVLETKQGRKDNTTGEQTGFLSCKDDR